MMRPDDGRVISNFILQAISGKDISIYGSGKQTRSFQYIDDLISAMIRMMNTDDDFIGPSIGNLPLFKPHPFYKGPTQSQFRSILRNQ